MRITNLKKSLLLVLAVVPMMQSAYAEEAPEYGLPWDIEPQEYGLPAPTEEPQEYGLPVPQEEPVVEEYSRYLITGQFGSDTENLSLNENGGMLSIGCLGRAEIIESVFVTDDNRNTTVTGSFTYFGSPSLHYTSYSTDITFYVSEDESEIIYSLKLPDGKIQKGKLDRGHEMGDILCPEPIVDTDGDGISDEQDNCPREANPDQADWNGNGIGNACEEGDDHVPLEINPDECLSCSVQEQEVVEEVSETEEINWDYGYEIGE